MDSLEERRDESDRRDSNAIPEFSLIDANGELVTTDRRAKRDRRSGINVTQTTMSEKEFAEYFRKVNSENIY